MPKVKRSTVNGKPAWLFECPAEGCMHFADERWTFNGNEELPTFTPSFLVSSTRMTDKGIADYNAWSDAGYPKRTEPFDSVPMVCHSFVTDGKIQYLNDCTHELAGQTLEIPDWKE